MRGFREIVVLLCLSAGTYAADHSGRDWAKKPLLKDNSVVEPLSDEEVSVIENEGKDRPFIQGSLGVDYFVSKGEASWDTFFADYAGAPSIQNLFLGGSRLEWEKLETQSPVVNAKLTFFDTLSVQGKWSTGESDGGDSSDTDVFVTLFTEPAFIYSESDAESNLDFYDVNLHLDFAGIFPDQFDADQSLGIFVGYMSYAEEYISSGGRTLVYLNQVIDEPFPPGVSGQYDAEWTGFRVGLDCFAQFENAVGNMPLTFQGSATYMPFLEYEGDGYWFLRDDFRQGEPSFSHRGDKAVGYEFEATLTLGITDHFNAYVGARLTHMELDDDGDATNFGADGTEYVLALVGADVERVGFFAGVGFTF